MTMNSKHILVHGTSDLTKFLPLVKVVNEVPVRGRGLGTKPQRKFVYV